MYLIVLILLKLANATKDALNKANLALEPLGSKIIGVKSVKVQQGGGNNFPRMEKYAMDAIASPSTSIYAKNLEFNVFVDVEFFIKNKSKKHWKINKIGKN